MTRTIEHGDSRLYNRSSTQEIEQLKKNNHVQKAANVKLLLTAEDSCGGRLGHHCGVVEAY